MKRILAYLAAFAFISGAAYESHGQAVEIRRGTGSTVNTNFYASTNSFQSATNGMVIKVNGTNVVWPVRLIDSSTVAVTNDAGSVYFTVSSFATTTNVLTDTNMFRLATNGMITMFTGYTNVATDTNIFRLATNGIIGMFTTYTNVATDTNIFRLATNGIITMFTGYTNVAVDTNTFNKGYKSVTRPTYDGVETTVILINGNSGDNFHVDITKNTTLRFTNMWNGALTNAVRSGVNVEIRQDSAGTWTVGTQITNCLIAFGVGGTNLGVRSNANTVSWGSFAGSMTTNSQMQGSVVTNSVP